MENKYCREQLPEDPWDNLGHSSIFELFRREDTILCQFVNGALAQLQTDSVPDFMCHIHQYNKQMIRTSNYTLSILYANMFRLVMFVGKWSQTIREQEQAELQRYYLESADPGTYPEEAENPGDPINLQTV